MLLPKLYLISDGCGRDNLYDIIEGALRGGVRLVQVREKTLLRGELQKLLISLRELTKEYGALLIISRDIELAMEVGADGVHLGGGLSGVGLIRKVRERQREEGVRNFLIIYSVHSEEEGKAVEKEGVDAITYSPIYGVLKGDIYYAGKGLEELGNLMKEVLVPIFGLGGIKERNIEETLRTGVHGVGMMSEIMSAEDSFKKSREVMLKVYGEGGGRGLRF